MSDHAALFIGLGNMGGPMAVNFGKSHELFVHDTAEHVATRVAEAAGATAIPNLEELPSQIDTVVLMLPGSRVVEAVVGADGGLLARLPAGALIIDMSSSEPASTSALAEQASAAGIDYVDAPVSGGVAKARSGQLAVMAGGSDAAVTRARPHLEALGSSIVHVGPSGSGHAAKALNNLLSATNLAAAAEILTVAAGGIAPEKMLEVISGSTGRSQASEVKYPNHVLTGTFDSGFSMDLMLKDLTIAAGLIDDAGAEAQVTLTAREIALKARQGIDADDPDHTEVARYYENRNGQSLRSGDEMGTT